MADNYGLYNVLAGQNSQYPFGINPNSKHYANDVNAALLRSQFADWATRYAPIEDELLQAYGNDDMRVAAQNNAVGLFDKAFDSTPGITQRRLAGYGLTLTPEQQRSLDRSQNLARGLGEVDAFNRTGREIDDRNNRIMTGLAGSGGA